MKRDAVLFYRSFAEAIRQLPEQNQLQAFWAIIDYGIDGEEPEDGLAKAVYLMAKPQIDANNRRYENGKLGGRPKNQNKTKQKPKQNQSETKPKAKEKDKDKDKDKDKNKSDLELALESFKDHRKKLKAPMTDRAYELMLNKLEKLSGGDERKKIAILNQSIENGWKGIFELRGKVISFNNHTSRSQDMAELEKMLLST